MSKKRMKLHDFAKQQGIAYGTVYRYWKSGRIEGIQLPTGTILVSGWKENLDAVETKRVIIYARVSDPRQRTELSEQVKKLREHVSVQGYQLVEEIEEVGYGFSAARQKLIEVLMRDDWDILLVEHKEVPIKFAFEYLQAALHASGRSIEYRTHLPSSAENVLVALMHNTQQVISKMLGISHKRQILEAVARIES